jgi:hypothetical protein
LTSRARGAYNKKKWGAYSLLTAETVERTEPFEPDADNAAVGNIKNYLFLWRLFPAAGINAFLFSADYA